MRNALDRPERGSRAAGSLFLDLFAPDGLLNFVWKVQHDKRSSLFLILIVGLLLIEARSQIGRTCCNIRSSQRSNRERYFGCFYVRPKYELVYQNSNCFFSSENCIHNWAFYYSTPNSAFHGIRREEPRFLFGSQLERTARKNFGKAD